RAGEGDGEESADDSEHGIGDQLAAVAKVDGGNAEDRLGAEESALHNRAGDCGEHDGAEHGGAPLADDFLNDEQDGGNGGVEGGSEAGGSADGCEDAEPLPRHSQLARDHGRYARADLQGWVFRAKGVAGSDGNGGGYEFSDNGFEGNIAVIDVKGGFGLVDSAAARGGENQLHHGGNEQAGKRGNKNQTKLPGMRRGAEGENFDPFDGDLKADDEQPRDDSDEDGQDQKEALVACRGELGGVHRGGGFVSVGQHALQLCASQFFSDHYCCTARGACAILSNSASSPVDAPQICAVCFSVLYTKVIMVCSSCGLRSRLRSVRRAGTCCHWV